MCDDHIFYFILFQQQQVLHVCIFDIELKLKTKK